MAIRLSPMLLLPAVLGAAVAAYFLTDRAPSTVEAAAAAPPTETAASPRVAPVAAPSEALPPNHPPISGLSPRGDVGMGGENQQPPSISWITPKDWSTQSSESSMRLATYKVGDGAELYVVRAGGTVDANVDRWAGQFDGSPRPVRTDKRVRGLSVTVVRIDGTFLGGGMGAAPERHEHWSMLAAIVASTGSPYFFKMVGPTGQVEHARASFDALVDSLAPRSGD